LLSIFGADKRIGKRGWVTERIELMDERRKKGLVSDRGGEPDFYREFLVKERSIPHESANFLIKIDGER
jgi:hypothetical protein